MGQSGTRFCAVTQIRVVGFRKYVVRPADGSGTAGRSARSEPDSYVVATVVRPFADGPDFVPSISADAGVGGPRGERGKAQLNGCGPPSWPTPPSTDPEENPMFEDQTIELLPARTTMKKWGNNGKGNKTKNVAVNVAVVKVDFGEDNTFEDEVNLDIRIDQDASAG